MNAKEFMTELYKGVPPDQVTDIFTLPDHMIYPFTIGQMDRMLDKARAFNESKDVYFGLHLIHAKEETDDWEFVQVYTDEGISATNTKRREGFNAMVRDALNGKIEIKTAKLIQFDFSSAATF